MRFDWIGIVFNPIEHRLRQTCLRKVVIFTPLIRRCLVDFGACFGKDFPAAELFKKDMTPFAIGSNATVLIDSIVVYSAWRRKTGVPKSIDPVFKDHLAR